MFKMAAFKGDFWALLFLVISSVNSAQERVPLEKVFKRGHTNNWAVLVCTSRFWFNYRHVANVLSVYHSVKRLGIPDSHIILMSADDMACNARNPKPGTVYNNVNQHINLYGDDVEVDYRGYDVTVENFIRILTGRLPDSVPRSKRLLSDERSNILVYMTGHGGDGFLKFQDAEEVTSVELADAFEQMWQKRRYHELFFIVDTCQAYSMASRLYSPNVLAVGSSLVGEDSLSHHDDPSIGVHVIDRYTYYLLQFLEKVQPDSKATLAQLFRYTTPSLVISTPGARTDLFRRDLEKTLITDFFGSVHDVEMSNISSAVELQESRHDCSAETCESDSKSTNINHDSHQYSSQFPVLPSEAKEQHDGWVVTQGYLVALMVFALSAAITSML